MTPDELLETAHQSIKSSDYCFLITIGTNGQANARLMQHFYPDNDFSFWFGARADSRKVQDIHNNSKITLAFLDAKDAAYVTMIGPAEVENDMAKRQKYWKENWISFFESGPLGEDYALIHFVPARIELMNFGRGVTPEPYGLKPAVLVKKGGKWVEEEGMPE